MSDNFKFDKSIILLKQYSKNTLNFGNILKISKHLNLVSYKLDKLSITGSVLIINEVLSIDLILRIPSLILCSLYELIIAFFSSFNFFLFSMLVL